MVMIVVCRNTQTKTPGTIGCFVVDNACAIYAILFCFFRSCQLKASQPFSSRWSIPFSNLCRSHCPLGCCWQGGQYVTALVFRSGNHLVTYQFRFRFERDSSAWRQVVLDGLNHLLLAVVCTNVTKCKLLQTTTYQKIWTSLLRTFSSLYMLHFLCSLHTRTICPVGRARRSSISTTPGRIWIFLSSFKVCWASILVTILLQERMILTRSIIEPRFPLPGSFGNVPYHMFVAQMPVLQLDESFMALKRSNRWHSFHMPGRAMQFFSNTILKYAWLLSTDPTRSWTSVRAISTILSMLSAFFLNHSELKFAYGYM